MAIIASLLWKKFEAVTLVLGLYIGLILLSLWLNVALVVAVVVVMMLGFIMRA